MDYRLLLVCCLLLCGAWFSVHKRKLTVAGAIAGGAIGLCIYVGSGVIGLLLLGSFFISGTFATNWQASKKRLLFSESGNAPRHLGQVLANGGAAGILGLSAFLFPPYKPLFLLMIAGAFAAATADTLSSELGTVYGKRFYNILTFRSDKRGLDGAVSLEGLGIGVLGSAVIAMLYSAGVGWSVSFWWIILGGTAGNLADSILGAALERRGWIKNDVVNFINTVTAASICWVLAK
jgi:uncharacterized protein (TIGR00297 family)